ncbi:MAG: 23S rRNA (adenine(2030)-N(6))-methyltransferase RlmJ [Proteobacteria bacterium]|nr:23S rRNA (adenine(2030)-N(6))-methyltransferase RlmJ [Pseudomonadota bacterium]MBI3499346.1 23S rRNA (adenine(2030)-N(6))-methyltransferase RlmJ [Pseudomonadota bacterium]
MNYRHAYHAGCFSDVVKHAVLVLLIRHLKEKPKPFVILDTHAGIGRYDLASEPALKTREFEAGIARVLADPSPPAELRSYLDLVRSANSGPELRWYPGSPWLANALLGARDRLVLAELHPEDARTLGLTMGADRRIQVHHMDGYRALKSMLPPKERRGLVLIDPPFEVTDEAERIARGLKHAHKRWATGLYAIWYPIKDRPPIDRLHGLIVATGIRRMLVAELLLRPPRSPETLNGSGLVLVNPPWRLDESLKALLPALLKSLGAARHGSVRLDWLVPE